MLEQFGGPDGQLAAAMRYSTQGLVIGSIVAMLNKGAKAQISDGSRRQQSLIRSCPT
jgi:Mn-containing catalase